MEFIDLHKQFEQIEKPMREAMDRVYKHKKFILGPEVGELEKELAEFVGVKHVIACASGTDALVLPLMAMGLSREDAVFVPSFTFFATAESVTLAGGTPVFVDSDPDTFNMCPKSLEDAIINIKAEGKYKTRAIIPVDLFGLPANFKEIREVANKYKLDILEDAAQGFGGEISGERACSFGRVAATSFFPAKPLGCYGDGGAIFTNDDELKEKIKSIHVHGQGQDKYDNVRTGLNSRLDTMQAVVLREKLKIFPAEVEARNKVADLYTEKLKSILKTPDIAGEYISSWAQYTVQARDEEERNLIIQGLKDRGIPSMIYYPIPIHQSTAYKEEYHEYTKLTTCEQLSKTVFSLPMHPYMTEEDVLKVCDAIVEILA